VEVWDVVRAVDFLETLDGVDALAILTEWNEFRTPDFDAMRQRMRQSVIFDGRNLYSLNTIRRRGFEYHGIGCSTQPPVAEAS
jgi:UDPglucose 6-dehydrogenase